MLSSSAVRRRPPSSNACAGVCLTCHGRPGTRHWFTRGTRESSGFRVEPLTSLTDAVATWPERCTSVAVSLSATDALSVIAPSGLDDLFGLVLRRNPRRVTVEIFRRRLSAKRIRERWPEVTVIDG